MQQHIQGEYYFLPQEHILFGVGSLQRLPDEVRRIGAKRALIISGSSLATRTDVVERVVQVLGDMYVGIFHEIRQHAPKSDVARAASMARSLQADVLISVGGGSPIDATKAVAYALFQEQGAFLPHIAIPTTLSAAEFAQVAGVTDEDINAKTGFSNPGMTPRSVILDAALTMATPLQLWLSTGIRALDHAVETLYAPGVHPINDVLALEAIRRLFVYLPLSQTHPPDLEVRTELQLAAWMSFFGQANTKMGLSHNLGRRIGATYHVPHGITSCITLPVVMHAMATKHAPQLARIAQTLGLATDKTDPPQAAYTAANAVYNLISSLGLPQHLHAYDIKASDLHTIALNTVGQGPQLTLVEELLKEML